MPRAKPHVLDTVPAGRLKEANVARIIPCGWRLCTTFHRFHIITDGEKKIAVCTRKYRELYGD